MKIVKSYFNEDNALNKGYRMESKESNKKSFSKDNAETLSLEEYEEMGPGSMKVLLEIAKKEQEHQHYIDRYQVRSNILAKYFGYLCGALTFISLAFVSFFIISISTIVGLVFVICTFGALFAKSIIKYLSKGNSNNHYQSKNKNRFHKRF